MHLVTAICINLKNYFLLPTTLVADYADNKSIISNNSDTLLRQQICKLTLTQWKDGLSNGVLKLTKINPFTPPPLSDLVFQFSTLPKFYM